MFLGELAHKIRSQREKRGLKQQDVAHALRLSPQAVSKWERGENAPDIALLAPLARLLGVTTDWLLASAAGGPDVFDATVLVSSVLGAYDKSRRMEPRDFAVWANGLFFTLTEVTLRHGGVPVKYMGDQYLCFFSGTQHEQRALSSARTAAQVVAERLAVALSTGQIYLGSMGHPDYARPDIMGEVVNIGFLALEWAEKQAQTALVATLAVVEQAGALATVQCQQEVNFRGVSTPVTLCQVVQSSTESRGTPDPDAQQRGR